MTLPNFTTPSVTFGDIALNGGLNSTAGPLSVQNNESSNLQNIDFSKFGSILKRNGYTALNTSAIATSPDIEGLQWFEYDSSGTTTRTAICVAGAKLFKMDGLDATWDDITGGLTITAGNACDFDNFLNECYITNNADVPFLVNASLTSEAMSVPTGLTAAKYVKQFNNYLFLGNVLVSATRHGSRIYWSNLKDTDTWSATAFIEIAKDDGQEITGMKVLGDRLVVFKSRSIYNVFFTGDADIPFILPGGGKSNSSVGCASGHSIQEVENGLVFLSYDGFYYYDGINSHKISDKITTTILGLNISAFEEARSLVYKSKNKYMCALPASGSAENNRVLVWDWFNNAWSLYTGMAPAAMATFHVGGTAERPYWGDYAGFVYRGDVGDDDYPLNVQTAINAIYYTNWRPFGDLVNKKGVSQVTIYCKNSNTTLTFGYDYDFEGDAGGLAENDNTSYSSTISLATSSDVYGVGLYGTAVYAGEGGDIKRRDITGRGRLVRFMFSNSTLAETFQIDGFGTFAHLETNV